MVGSAVHDEGDLGTTSSSNQTVADAKALLDGSSMSALAYQNMKQENPSTALGRSQSVLRMSQPLGDVEGRPANLREKNWKASDGITLEWRNLSYTIQRSRGKDKEQILKDLCGEARPGEVVAILGGSGAGSMYFSL